MARAGTGGGALPPPSNELGGCDVIWTPDPDPDRNAYAFGHAALDPDDAYHAVMANGEATIPSMINPGRLIRLVVELSLCSDDFWMNDRGLDPETGKYIYGNHRGNRGIPYKMRRATSLVGRGTDRQQSVMSDALAWTLWGEWWTAEEYERKMDAIGGASTKMNAPGKLPR